jgi:hypothetical protein
MIFYLFLSLVSSQTCPFAPQAITVSMSNPIPPVGKFTLFAKLFGTDLIVGTNEALYRSLDGGKTLTKLGAPNKNYWGAWKTTSGVILAPTSDSFYRSTNNGATFTSRLINVPKPAGQQTYPLSSTAYNMFAQVGNQVIWITQNFLYVSENDGLTWSLIDCLGIKPERGLILHILTQPSSKNSRLYRYFWS